MHTRIFGEPMAFGKTLKHSVGFQNLVVRSRRKEDDSTHARAVEENRLDVRSLRINSFQGRKT
jgi:hypothetical protein